VAGLWFSQGTSVSSTNKTDCHDITEILLKVALNTIIPNPPISLTFDLKIALFSFLASTFVQVRTLSSHLDSWYLPCRWITLRKYVLDVIYEHTPGLNVKTFLCRFCTLAKKTSNQNVMFNKYSALIGWFWSIHTHT
jgi:hypothetical protein